MGTKRDPGAYDVYDQAEDDEPMFVLLARDQTAPDIVRAWAVAREERLRDSTVQMTAAEFFAELDQVAEAHTVSHAMVAWRDEHRR